MTTFFPFPRLPLELRRRVWEMSVEPREVAVGPGLVRRGRSPPPAWLQVCGEARTYFRTKYRKVYGSEENLDVGGLQQKEQDFHIYAWVNVDIDVVYCSQYPLKQVTCELPSVRWLIVETRDEEFWFYRDCSPLTDICSALETVTILHPPPSRPGGVVRFDNRWWSEWDSWMESVYFTCAPVTFRTRIIWPEFPEAGEVNPDNYLKLERDARRETKARYPDFWEEGYEVSDDDDERMSAPHRFRTGFRHADGCNCSYKK